jgi:DNA-binding CsgD family transcriptional regulator
MAGSRAERVQRARRELERLAGAGLERESLFRQAARVLQRVVPFDGGCWHTLDPATLLITSHWTNLSGDGFPMIVESEYRHEDVGKFASLAGRRVPASALSAEDAPGSVRFLAYRNRGWGSELRASFDLDGETWGAVMLLRGTDLPAFTDADARLVAGLGRQLAAALRMSLAVAAAAATPFDEQGPGLLVLDEGDHVESATIAARAWLGDLERAGLPPAVLSVAASARGARDPARARIRSSSGQWLLLQGSRLGETGGRVAVVVEPARASEVAPLLASAYGLSVRERDVLREVLHGRSTKEIAAALHLVPYTVQDHLKSIFEKTDTGSRSELVARLFFEQFEPRLGDPLAAGRALAREDPSDRG